MPATRGELPGKLGNVITKNFGKAASQAHYLTLAFALLIASEIVMFRNVWTGACLLRVTRVISRELEQDRAPRLSFRNMTYIERLP
jgi:hypothetical protein